MNEDKMRKAFVAYATSGESHIKGGLSWDSVEVRNVSEAFRAGWQAATRAAVPDGWKAVPLEPTPEMIEEGERAHWGKEMDKMSPTPTEFYDECGGPIGYAWIAMLAAAPEVKP